ncbi:MAG: hypothetical protein GAK28_01857 [Luteibacter sp.]|nr:MAG: hypothetical protein GAK28_01857 [Luteibacter sp.]
MLNHSLPNMKGIMLATLAASGIAYGDMALAGDVPAGGSRTIDGQTLPENWTVQVDGTLNVVNGSRIGSVDATHAYINLYASSVLAPTGQFGIQASNGSRVDIRDATVSATASGSRGVVLAGTGSGVGAGEASLATINNSTIEGAAYGASLSANSVLDVAGSQVTGTAANGMGIGLFSGTATFRDGSVVTGQANGAQIMTLTVPGVPDGGRTLILDNATLTGVTGSGVLVQRRNASSTSTATISLRNGASVSGGNGTAFELGLGAQATIDVDASHVLGDLKVATGSSATMALRNGSTMQGVMTGDIAATVADTATTWNVTGDSDVSSLTLNGGAINFAARGEDHSNLLVRGDFAGTGGSVTLNTVMNEGGPLSAQATDRLLVQGNVTTTGTTYINIAASGAGANTDTNGNDRPDANEGISLVQVGGHFAKRCVRPGPWFGQLRWLQARPDRLCARGERSLAERAAG